MRTGPKKQRIQSHSHNRKNPTQDLGAFLDRYAFAMWLFVAGVAIGELLVFLARSR